MTEDTLTFNKLNTYTYEIKNNKGKWLGDITKKRIGNFHKWVFCPRPFERLGDYWLLNKTHQEIIDFTKKLGRR